MIPRPRILILLAVIGSLYWFRQMILNMLPATSDISNPLLRKDVRIALREQAQSGGYPPEWFDAIAYVGDWTLLIRLALTEVSAGLMAQCR
jgi:hypothetical protein